MSGTSPLAHTIPSVITSTMVIEGASYSSFSFMFIALLSQKPRKSYRIHVVRSCNVLIVNILSPPPIIMERFSFSILFLQLSTSNLKNAGKFTDYQAECKMKCKHWFNISKPREARGVAGGCAPEKKGGGMAADWLQEKQALACFSCSPGRNRTAI